MSTQLLFMHSETSIDALFHPIHLDIYAPPSIHFVYNCAVYTIQHHDVNSGNCSIRACTNAYRKFASNEMFQLMVWKHFFQQYFYLIFGQFPSHHDCVLGFRESVITVALQIYTIPSTHIKIKNVFVSSLDIKDHHNFFKLQSIFWLLLRHCLTMQSCVYAICTVTATNELMCLLLTNQMRK